MDDNIMVRIDKLYFKELLNTNMSNIILAFEDGLVILTSEFITNRGNNVLLRLCGLKEGFGHVNSNEHGHLTFPLDYGITRQDFLKCIHFLRTGILNDEAHIGAMSNVFNILGGFDEWDAFLKHKEDLHAKKNKQEAIKKEQRLHNPLTPEDNVLDLFVFEAHQTCWSHSGEWQTTAALDHSNTVFWWRKKKD